MTLSRFLSGQSQTLFKHRLGFLLDVQKSICSLGITLGLALFLVSSTGCGSKVVKDFEKLRDEMCACKDHECVTLVSKKREKWNEANKRAKGSQSQFEDLNKAMAEYAACAQAIIDAQPGSVSETQ